MPDPAQSGEPPPGGNRPRNDRTPRRRPIKRALVGGFGLTAIGWSCFATYAIVTKNRGLLEGERGLLLAGCAIVFTLGVFGLRIALRGSDRDVDDFNLC
jgi:hypothetical protein